MLDNGTDGGQVHGRRMIRGEPVHLRQTVGDARPPTPETVVGKRISPLKTNPNPHGFNIISNIANNAHRFEPKPHTLTSRRLANHSLYTHDIISQSPRKAPDAVDPRVRTGAVADPADASHAASLRAAHTRRAVRPADHDVLGASTDAPPPQHPPSPHTRRLASARLLDHGYNIVTGRDANDDVVRPDPVRAPGPRPALKDHLRHAANLDDAAPQVAISRRGIPDVRRNTLDHMWRLMANDDPAKHPTAAPDLPHPPAPPPAERYQPAPVRALRRAMHAPDPQPAPAPHIPSRPPYAPSGAAPAPPRHRVYRDDDHVGDLLRQSASPRAVRAAAVAAVATPRSEVRADVPQLCGGAVHSTQ
ncbi:uncharacterized protein AMSG_07782 [Thecamonas trahens ATCC 50062]|uniref:Uncharacterized protein n=1 Tax=Thecamonas trahens ATCC 50062 TaxID=461836 RepID=A0A0L0DK32_THETB|nr:hypothetical protein AMSG_07782 [Thecamonas trahens ATCC 50062]KNC51713.1 hypothetical protein AMSG_07782 [Thecamonas trahens ATCC 50062]|eukprot:XP_013755842.1 hypothetical protein AMSG_07782 [Thecamonas trahens ATCC 50062]